MIKFRRPLCPAEVPIERQHSDCGVDIYIDNPTDINNFAAQLEEFRIELLFKIDAIDTITVATVLDIVEPDNVGRVYFLLNDVLFKQTQYKKGDVVKALQNGNYELLQSYYTLEAQVKDNTTSISSIKTGATNSSSGLIQGTGEELLSIRHSITGGKTDNISIKKEDGIYEGIDVAINANTKKSTKNEADILVNKAAIAENTISINAHSEQILNQQNVIGQHTTSIIKAESDITNINKVLPAKADKSDLANKAEKSEIPTKTSQIINDSGFINKDANDLTNYLTTQEVEDRMAGKRNAYTFNTTADFLSKSTIEGNRLYVTNSDGFKVATNIGDNIYTKSLDDPDYWVAYDNLVTTNKIDFLSPLNTKVKLEDYYTKIETDTKINDLEVKKGTHLQIDANGTYNATTNVVSFDIVDIYQFQDNQIVEFDFNLPIVGTIKNDAKFEIVEKSGTKINIITFNGLATFGLLKTIMTYSTETGYRWTMIGDLAYNNAVKSFLPILPSSSVLNLSVDTINLINNGTLRLTTDTYVVPTDSDTNFTKGQMYLWKNNVFELVNPYSTIEEVTTFPLETEENYNKKKLYLKNGKLYIIVKEVK